MVEDLDDRLTLLVRQMIRPTHELPTQVLNHFSFLLQSEVVNGICHKSGRTRYPKDLEDDGGVDLNRGVANHSPK